MFKGPCRRSDLLKSLQILLCVCVLYCQVKCAETGGNATDLGSNTENKISHLDRELCVFECERNCSPQTGLSAFEQSTLKAKGIDFLKTKVKSSNFTNNIQFPKCHRMHSCVSSKNSLNFSRRKGGLGNSRPMTLNLICLSPLGSNKDFYIPQNIFGKQIFLSGARYLRKAGDKRSFPQPLKMLLKSIEKRMNITETNSSSVLESFNCTEQTLNGSVITTGRLALTENLCVDIPGAECSTAAGLCLSKDCYELTTIDDPCTDDLSSSKIASTSCKSSLMVKENSNKRSITLLLVSMICPQVRNKIKQCIPWLATTSKAPPIGDLLLPSNSDCAHKGKSQLQKIIGWFT